MCTCTSWLEGWFSLFLNRGLLPSSAPDQLVPTVVLQEPVPLSSESCRRRSSAAQPLKTRHIPCVSWSLYPQVKHPHVALSTEVYVDLISSHFDLGNAQERTLHWANLPDDPAALSLIRVGFPPAPRKISPDFEAGLGFGGIHCIMFSGSAFASAPLPTTAEIFTIPFLVRSSATCSRIMSLSSSHSDP